MFKLETYIFPEFHTLYDKLTDPNKDADDKGTQERFMETVGKELDDNFMPYVDNMQENLLEPQTVLTNLLAYLESELGYQLDWDWFFLMPIAFRRNLYDIMPKLYQIRGTLLCHQIMLGWLGYTIILNEVYSEDTGFDSDDTFDSDDDTLDTTCEPCSTYSINLVSAGVFDVADVVAIITILEFNQPINAVLTDITFNGSGISQEFNDFSPDFNYDFSNATPPLTVDVDVIAWYKGDVGVVTSGVNTVSTWLDQSANGYHLTLDGGNPILIGTTVSVVAFQGLSLLTSLPITHFSTLNRLTFLIVMSGAWAGFTDNAMISIGDTSTYDDDGKLSIRGNNDDTIGARLPQGGVYASTTLETDAALRFVKIEFDRTTGADAPAIEIYGLANTPTTSTLNVTGNFVGDKLFVGDIDGNGVMTFRIGEMIIIDHLLSAPEQVAYESYLVTKYGL